jgi:hypothetical protein
MYTSVIVIMFAIFLTTPTLLEGLFFIILVVILILKAKKEENLWIAHDKTYIDYQKRTKFFIPYIAYTTWKIDILMPPRDDIIAELLYIFFHFCKI